MTPARGGCGLGAEGETRSPRRPTRETVQGKGDHSQHRTRDTSAWGHLRRHRQQGSETHASPDDSPSPRVLRAENTHREGEGEGEGGTEDAPGSQGVAFIGKAQLYNEPGKKPDSK